MNELRPTQNVSDQISQLPETNQPDEQLPNIARMETWLQLELTQTKKRDKKRRANISRLLGIIAGLDDVHCGFCGQTGHLTRCATLEAMSRTTRAKARDTFQFFLSEVYFSPESTFGVTGYETPVGTPREDFS